MYAAYFGLSQAPFSIAPDPRFLYLSQRHREALAHLLYGLQAGGGFVLLTGDIGSGKTTVCRSLLQQAPAGVQLAYVFNPKLDAVELLQTICEEFRLPLPEGEPRLKPLIALLNAFLLQAHAAGQRCVLIIDEAQNLSADVLEQLRLLTNLETSEHKLLQIILIGQPELRQLLEQPALAPLAQRILARYHLQALDLADTRRYVEHRLRVAGRVGPLPFSQAALRRLQRGSQGVPRRINLLCDRALLGAYARRQQQVDAALVDLATAEVQGHAAPRPWRWAGAAAAGVLALSAAAVSLWSLGQRAAPTATAGAAVTPVDHAAQRSTGIGSGSVSVTSPSMAQVPPGSSAKPATRETPAAAAAPMAAPVASQTATDAVATETAATQAAAPRRDAMPPLANLRDDEGPLWQQLARGWGLELPLRNRCDAALAAQVQCFRTSGLTVAGLRQLDRPGLLRLQQAGTSRWVLAQALEGDQLLLSVGEQRWRLPLAELPRWWQGDYATLWRLPAGQRSRLYAATPQDAAGQWLDRRLRTGPASSPSTAQAANFQVRVKAFQQQHGLHGDGKALPSTFLLVNRLAGVDEPRLQPAASR